MTQNAVAILCKPGASCIRRRIHRPHNPAWNYFLIDGYSEYPSTVYVLHVDRYRSGLSEQDIQTFAD
jgi:hypothetical protein